MAIICHVPSTVEIGRVVVGVKIFKCWKFTFVWSLYPITQRCFVSSLAEIEPMVLKPLSHLTGLNFRT